MSAQRDVGLPAQRMYRCEGCGKWSHAVRKPKRHTRFAAGIDSAEAAAQGLTVIGSERYFGPDDVGEMQFGGVEVECGPFAEWIAIPVPAVPMMRVVT